MSEDDTVDYEYPQRMRIVDVDVPFGSVLNLVIKIMIATVLGALLLGIVALVLVGAYVGLTGKPSPW